MKFFDIKQKPLHIPPHIICPSCNTVTDSPDLVVKGWLSGENTICGSCNNNLDAWDIIFNDVKNNFMRTRALIPFGAHSVLFIITMKPTEIYNLKLVDYGVPESSRILSINYTGRYNGTDQFVTPLEMHGNQPIRHDIPNCLSLYPAGLGGKTPSADSDIQIEVIWVPNDKDNYFWNNLFEACEFYTKKQYAKLIVPANVAVEAKLTQFLYQYLSKTISNTKVDNFLKNGASYSHQLNVVLPLAVQLIDFHDMPEMIRGELNRLRDLRNQIAHNGSLKNTLSSDDAARLLCAALFGLYYVELLQEISILNLPRRDNQNPPQVPL